MTEHAAVERARALVGTRFRAQGRDPRFGLDCLGLAIFSYALPTSAGRSDYRLRGEHRRVLEAGLAPWFRRIGHSRRPGDLLLMQAGPEQIHLGIMSAAGFIHADARLGRVVETPGSPPWPLVAVYRRRVRSRRAGRG